MDEKKGRIFIFLSFFWKAEFLNETFDSLEISYMYPVYFDLIYTCVPPPSNSL